MADTKYKVDGVALKSLSKNAQLEAMESWFRENFENPDFRTPYDSEEGRYWYEPGGGPFDALEQLSEEFDGLVPSDVIEKLADTLNGESYEWASVPSETAYEEHYFDEFLVDAFAAFPAIKEGAQRIRDLLQSQSPTEHSNTLNQLFFANAVTLMETYLSDTFINRVLADKKLLRRLFESSPEFHKERVAKSEIFRVADNATEEAKKYLVRVLWHNLPKVERMYRDVLQVDIRKHMPPLTKAIETRHDIVHRNGRSKDGTTVIITSQDVGKLVEAVQDLAEHVEKQLLSTTSDDDDSAF
jgi:hypothetical protein